ncbi:tetratricopeptide repeat protein [Actinophytocola xanthii]|uniref:MalT-like TPR region domain-containing protein n=1 Tax=Actinophytocola xanthii TaxID=1912961 RepID=A0A1Q8CXM0_9PSEU|nr:tetratricopeptide repeat protein [Actinophytocola xanthii]OLF19109.1 hypothetical protein BU204_01675 [Actinophytocola xanthii]
MGRPERRLLTRVKLLLFGAVTWFVATLLSEQLGAEAGESWWGTTVGPLLLPVLTGVAVLAGVGWLVLVLLDRPREPTEPEPPRIEHLPWHAPSEPLFGRSDELEQARDRVLRLGAVVLAGVRDIGTSAVAEHVTQRLVEKDGGDPSRIFRFDLRSRSTSEPYDAVQTAARFVTAFGVDEPSDSTDEVLDRAAEQLLDKMPGQGAILFLDNVSTPEQVAWLLRRWPTGTWPRLVVAGETAVGDAAESRVVPVLELPLVHLREIWEREVPEPAARQRILDLLRRLRGPRQDDPVDALLAASCAGRPGAVKTLAREIRRLSAVESAEESVRRMLVQLRAKGQVHGPLERVWTAILDNIRDGLTVQEAWLLRALAELPVTGITWGTVDAIVRTCAMSPPGGNATELLEALRLRNLVREQDGRYRVPQEIRGPLLRTEPAQRRAVALCAVPALVRYFAGFVEEWAGRLDVDTTKARDWFRDSEPSLRPLFQGQHRPEGELLALVFDHLCVIADGLNSWYVREQQSRGLLEVSQGLYELALANRREDVAAVAVQRIAAAHRLARRPGDALPWLDIARSHAMAVHGPVRTQLDIREWVERALLAAAGPEPDSAAIGAAMTALEALRAGADRPEQAVMLVNLGMLAILQKQPDEALECLREAEKVARDARDAGSEAHSVELQGTALATQDGTLVEAARCWQRARTVFRRIGEDPGEARCLQHLGAAALCEPGVAGLVRVGRPVPLPGPDAAAVALALLERAKELRTGQPDTELVDHYLDQARRALKS